MCGALTRASRASSVELCSRNARTLGCFVLARGLGGGDADGAVPCATFGSTEALLTLLRVLLFGLFGAASEDGLPWASGG